MEPEELAQLQEMVTKAAEAIESKLAATLNTAIEGINSRVDQNAAATAESQSQAKAAFEILPGLIQEHVENQLQANLKGIVEEVGNQFEEKAKAMVSGSGADGAMFDKLLANSDKIIGVVNAFRSPTTEQAMMGQMNFVMKWHSLLSKLEKGGGSGDEVTKAIADTFTSQKQE